MGSGAYTEIANVVNIATAVDLQIDTAPFSPDTPIIILYVRDGTAGSDDFLTVTDLDVGRVVAVASIRSNATSACVVILPDGTSAIGWEPSGGAPRCWHQDSGLGGSVVNAQRIGDNPRRYRIQAPAFTGRTTRTYVYAEI